MRQILRSNPQEGAPFVARKLFETGVADVSRWTARRDLSRTCKAKRRPLCPNLKDSIKIAARLQWCVNVGAKLDPGAILFSDEKIFRAGETRRIQWCAPGKEPEPVERKRYVARFHVWGVIGVGAKLLKRRAEGDGSGAKGGVNRLDYIVAAFEETAPWLPGKALAFHAGWSVNPHRQGGDSVPRGARC